MTQKVGEVELKILDHNHNKNITTHKFMKLAPENFSATLIQAKLWTKNEIDKFLKKTNFDGKLKQIQQKQYFK